MNPQPAFNLSIVVPVYNGASSVPTLVEALAGLDVPPIVDADGAQGGGLEIVLVNDCSPDNSLDVCRALCAANSVALTVVNLSRNYGEHNAVMAGLSHARGAYIITMDDDLQNPPEEVLRLWHHAAANQYDVVYTYYAEKQHEAWRNLGSRFTNWCADYLLDKPKGLYLSSFRCISAFVAREVTRHNGPFPYVDGLIMQITQKIGRLQVSHLARAEGRSNYTLPRLLRLFLSMFLNFSVIPLRVGTLIGVAMAGLGVLGFLVVLIEAMISSATPAGWASLMSAVLLLAGVQLIMLGLVGEYLGRMFITINDRPQFTVRDVTRNEKASVRDVTRNAKAEQPGSQA
ncbi:glycosyltransferase family 2 protein [Ferrovibrio sp.]|uniref:glycosyltransferase family 2 protein n=1 Tax=Ferrovibrio sp. TaxID=1917215 RepID=UPI0035B31A9F